MGRRLQGYIAVLTRELVRAAGLTLVLLLGPLVFATGVTAGLGAVADPSWRTALVLLVFAVVVAWRVRVFDLVVTWRIRARFRRERRGFRDEEPRGFEALVAEADAHSMAKGMARAWYHVALAIGCAVLAVTYLVVARYGWAALSTFGAAFWLCVAKKDLRDSQ